ncbi:MAG: macro domain-containing protein [Gammaproteobacteria bacterium]|nr:macro domain-containing protein [Gammaproteobacteria bacterium]
MTENNTCFVIMPYGVKEDIDGNKIDFDGIYKNLIKKACEQVEALKVLRCDDIQKPGFIHERMIEHILEDRVAIVDTSTLNANVFYELGVRHALRQSVTVLVHRQGTSWPFNIAGLSSIEYGESPAELRAARKTLCAYVKNALDDPDNVDSLVHVTIPNLRVERGPDRVPKRITRFGTDEYPLVAQAQKRIGFVTGDYEAINIADVWVTSENTDMQMASYYDKSTSATVRYLGARKHPVTGRVAEDTIADELASLMGDEKNVAPGTVVVTGAGALESNNVKWIFHAASVIGQPREGYKPIERIDRCVRNALKTADSTAVQSDPPRSILMPLFGTGPAGGDLETHVTKFIAAAVAYLENHPDSNTETVYFYVWSDVDLETCHRVAQECDSLGPQSTGDGAGG